MNGLATLRYLALPFHTAPLLLVALFSVMLRLALHAGLIGLPALLILGSWFFKYAFLLLDHAAHGRPSAPVLSMEDANPLGETRPLLYGMSVVVFYMATAALGEFTSLTSPRSYDCSGSSRCPPSSRPTPSRVRSPRP